MLIYIYFLKLWIEIIIKCCNYTDSVKPKLGSCTLTSVTKPVRVEKYI